MQKNPNRLICHPVEKKSKCIKDLNIQLDTWNLVEMKIWNSLEVIGTGKDFLNWIMLAQAIRPIIKRDTMILKSFCTAKIQSCRQTSSLYSEKIVLPTLHLINNEYMKYSANLKSRYRKQITQFKNRI